MSRSKIVESKTEMMRNKCIYSESGKKKHDEGNDDNILKPGNPCYLFEQSPIDLLQKRNSKRNGKSRNKRRISGELY